MKKQQKGEAPAEPEHTKQKGKGEKTTEGGRPRRSRGIRNRGGRVKKRLGGEREKADFLGEHDKNACRRRYTQFIPWFNRD